MATLNKEISKHFMDLPYHGIAYEVYDMPDGTHKLILVQRQRIIDEVLGIDNIRQRFREVRANAVSAAEAFSNMRMKVRGAEARRVVRNYRLAQSGPEFLYR